jgi:hypothetical protein
MIQHHSSQASRFNMFFRFSSHGLGFAFMTSDHVKSFTSPRKLTDEEILPVQMTVDGVALGRGDMIFQNNQPGSLRMVTSYLTAGSGSVKSLL